MAAYSWTPTDIIVATTRNTGFTKIHSSVSGAILQGDALTFHENGELIKAVATTVPSTIVIALSEGVAGQLIGYITNGPITYGAAVFSMADPIIYLGAAAAGTLVPYGDLVATNQVVIIGYATAATTLYLNPLITGVART